MIHQGAQAGSCREVGPSRLDDVATGQLQAANQGGIGSPRVQHLLPMVGLVPPSKEVKSQQESLSNALQRLEGWLLDASQAAGLNQGQVCAHIGNAKGGSYDQSQWTKARATGDLPFGRMLAGLPDIYLRTFAIALATSCGLRVSHDDLADLALEQTAVAIDALVRTVTQLRAQRRSA